MTDAALVAAPAIVSSSFLAGALYGFWRARRNAITDEARADAVPLIVFAGGLLASAGLAVGRMFS